MMMQQWQAQAVRQQAMQYQQQLQQWQYMQQWQAQATVQYQHQASQQQHQHHMMMLRHQEEEERRRMEEQRQREEDEKRRRIEELKKSTEATASIMKVIQKVRVATPECFDTLQKELDDVFAKELENTGTQRQMLLEEKDKALEQAKRCVEKINLLRRRQEGIPAPVAVNYLKSPPPRPQEGTPAPLAVAYLKSPPPRPKE